MTKMTVKYEGEKELKVDLRKLTKKVTIELRGATVETARKIANQSKINLTDNESVVTGRLRRSMTFVLYPIDIYADIGTNVFYGKYVEFGMGRARAKPYLGPAYNQFSPEYEKFLYVKLKSLMPQGK